VPVYRVIYDVRDTSDATFLLLVALFAVVGLALWAAGRADVWLLSRSGATAAAPGQERGFIDRAGRMRRVGMWMAFAAVLVCGSGWWVDWSGKDRLRTALESGEYTVVEGAVTEFERGDRGGHSDERFTVISSGRPYTYAYRSSHAEPGFHESHGPIREGMHLRIADVGGYIARLEVRTVEDPERVQVPGPAEAGRVKT
jgi:hypothetical protein